MPLTQENELRMLEKLERWTQHKIYTPTHKNTFSPSFFFSLSPKPKTQRKMHITTQLCNRETNTDISGKFHFWHSFFVEQKKKHVYNSPAFHFASLLNSTGKHQHIFAHDKCHTSGFLCVLVFGCSGKNSSFDYRSSIRRHPKDDKEAF